MNGKLIAKVNAIFNAELGGRLQDELRDVFDGRL